MLTPDYKFLINGVTVNSKIIPDGTRWKNAQKAKAAGFAANALYKNGNKLSGGTGKVQFVTIHNTADLTGVADDAEQYTRATYNENMGSTRVHFYVDENGAWQNLKAGTGLIASDPIGAAEVSWHSGDGVKDAGSGNVTSLSIEVIMGDKNSANDAKAKDNSARIAAWLLWRHNLGVDKLVSHTYWVNRSAGKTFVDVDDQCCNPVAGQKWCPTYIFASGYKITAKKNWIAYKALVKRYLDELNCRDGEFEVGDIVIYNGNAHYSGANSDEPKSCIGGRARITHIYQLGKAKHPYHIIRDGDGATVYGWVDAGSFVKAKV